jgi:hypothetical protein
VSTVSPATTGSTIRGSVVEADVLAEDTFESAVRSGGDLAGVFEYDGDTGYFYLYSTPHSAAGQKVLGSIYIISGTPDFSEEDLHIRWDRNERRVGLFIRGELWAVFDSEDRSKLGGNYRPGILSQITPDTASYFSNS